MPMDVARIVEKFSEAWNVEDPAERRRILEATCTEATEVSSPYGEHHGIEAQWKEIGEVRAQFPKFRCSWKVLAQHHNWLMDAWTSDFGDGRPPLRGIDVVLVGPEGRIAKVVSFSPVTAP